jgi:mono/diheme cytochrome c family protein
VSRRPAALLAFFVSAAVFAFPACDSGSPRQGAESPPAAAPTPSAPAAPAAPSAPAAAGAGAARDEALQIFETRCVTCHGPQGEGNGPASAGLTPPPRNFRDPAWQTSVTDAHIEQIIQYGGAAVGRSPAMPANPDLMSKPEVVTALREHVRSLGK